MIIYETINIVYLILYGKGEKMSKKLTDKKRKEMLAQRYQEIKVKSASRKRTEKELFEDDRVWEVH